MRNSDLLTAKEFDKAMVKLFGYLDKEFKSVNSNFEDLSENFHNLQSSVDAYAKQVEIYHQESIARDAKVDRLERWIEQLATKTGVKLEH